MSVEVCPGHCDGEFTVMTGSGLTVTVETAVLVHPPVVPVTVYDVVAAGVTLIEAVPAPVLQE